MSWNTVKEVLGFVGVIGSMLFVGLEIRQNNQLARANAYQELGLRAASVWGEMLHNEETAQLLAIASDSTRWDELGPAAWLRLQASVVSGLRARETVQLQVEAGVLPPDAERRLGYDLNYWPYLERVWPNIRRNFSEDFAVQMEAAYGITP